METSQRLVRAIHFGRRNFLAGDAAYGSDRPRASITSCSRRRAAGAAWTPLPTPDATGFDRDERHAAGKVALVNNTVALSGSGCPFNASVVDFIGYGGANCSEGGGAAPALTNTTAALRARGGCRDTNNNSVDFSVSSPNPRNSGVSAQR